METEQLWKEAVKAAALSESSANLADTFNDHLDPPSIEEWSDGVRGRAEELYRLMWEARPNPEMLVDLVPPIK